MLPYVDAQALEYFLISLEYYELIEKKPIGPLNVEAQKVSARVLSLVDLLVDQVHVDII